MGRGNRHLPLKWVYGMSNCRQIQDNPRVRKPKTKRLLLKFGGSENWQLLETETNQIAVQIYCMKSAVKQHANSS
jgi:hypothetical protein